MIIPAIYFGQGIFLNTHKTLERACVAHLVE